MGWTTPRTWIAGDRISALLLNEQLRDNLVALKAPPSQAIIRNNDVSYSTTSTAFVPVDSTNLSLSLTTNGGDVMVGMMGVIAADSTTSRHMSFDVRVDGSGGWLVDQGYGGGITTAVQSTIAQLVNIGPLIISGLAAGNHTFTLLWRMNAGTGYLRSDQNDSDYRYNVPVIFWAREIS